MRQAVHRSVEDHVVAVISTGRLCHLAFHAAVCGHGWIPVSLWVSSYVDDKQIVATPLTASPRVDREFDYAQAWAVFENRYGSSK